MAAKNSVKVYAPLSYYHIYNRGVEQRNIFRDKQDYSVFLSYLQTYLTPKDTFALQSILTSQNSSDQEKNKAMKLLQLKNYHLHIELICYAFLPNHFHLLIKQNTISLNSFMNSIGTRYAMYYNRKYKRKGVLFQDVYKAVLIESDAQLLHLSRYIHLNPIKFENISFSNWQKLRSPSSLPEYLGYRQASWIKKEYILQFFSKTYPKLSYDKFLDTETDQIPIEQIVLDDEME